MEVKIIIDEVLHFPRFYFYDDDDDADDDDGREGMLRFDGSGHKH